MFSAVTKDGENFAALACGLPASPPCAPSFDLVPFLPLPTPLLRVALFLSPFSCYPLSLRICFPLLSRLGHVFEFSAVLFCVCRPSLPASPRTLWTLAYPRDASRPSEVLPSAQECSQVPECTSAQECPCCAQAHTCPSAQECSLSTVPECTSAAQECSLCARVHKCPRVPKYGVWLCNACAPPHHSDPALRSCGSSF